MGVACVEAATAGAAVVDAARRMPNRVSVETARARAIATTTTVRFMVKPPATRGMAADILPNATPADARTSFRIAARDHGGDRTRARYPTSTRQNSTYKHATRMTSPDSTKTQNQN